jgi:hypothetical protein
LGRGFGHGRDKYLRGVNLTRIYKKQSGALY